MHAELDQQVQAVLVVDVAHQLGPRCHHLPTAKVDQVARLPPAAVARRKQALLVVHLPVLDLELDLVERR